MKAYNNELYVDKKLNILVINYVDGKCSWVFRYFITYRREVYCYKNILLDTISI